MTDFRILHIDSETGYRGGERQVQLLVEGLARRGVPSLVVSPRNAELLRRLNHELVEVAEWPPPGFLGPRSPALSRWLRSKALGFGATHVHAHTGNGHTAAVAAFRGRLPIIVTRRVDFPIKQNFFSRRKYLADGQHYIAISSAVRTLLLDAGIPEDRVTTVFSGIEPDRVRGGNGKALREGWLAGDAGPLVGFLGAFVDHKAPWILAEAAPLIRKELPGARVVFVGNGELEEQLRGMSAAEPEAIIMGGWHDQLADCYDAFDLFVLPSKMEGLGTSLADSLAAGIPVVATKAGGIPDLIKDGETGRLVPPLDSKALAKAIVNLWRDEDLRKRCIANGTKHLEQHFTSDAMVEGTLNVYRCIQLS